MGLWNDVKGIAEAPFSMLNSFLHPEKGYEDAEKQIERAWLESKGYLKPYAEAGSGQLPQLQGAENALLNPEELENKWASGYEMSPYAKEEMERAKNYGLDVASSMGLSGSSGALENIQRTGMNIMRSDRMNYLQDLINKYMAGVGIGQNIYGTGASSAGALATGRLQTGENLGQTAYGAASAPGSIFGRLAGTAIGGWLGGAPGAAAGGYAGGGGTPPAINTSGGFTYGA